MRLRLGAALGIFDPRLYREIAIEAEALGFEWIIVPEHLVLPVHMAGRPGQPDATDHAYPPATTPLADPFVALGVIAGATSTIRLATGVYVPGLRHPLVTARAVATLDVMSNGRVELGVGAGWLRSEWAAAQVPFAGRGRRLDEIIEICRRLWSEPIVRHDGDLWNFDEVAFEPKPVQTGGPPVHIGGNSPAALERAARIGNGWFPLPVSDRVWVTETVDWLRARRAELGRADEPFEVTLQVHDLNELDDWHALGVADRFSVAYSRDPDEMRRNMRLAARLASD